ncbi:MAG: DNA replication/repair protein RecF [Oscillospiraceae bacterium]|nr:DNA replication/repair protein RecF [Oscillospiraceae bacterium]
MRIDSIELEGFRNYESARAEFLPGVNVIIGDNAEGKTNLLEAIYVIAAGRSFRAKSDKELIGFSKSEARIRAEGFAGERDRIVEIIFRRLGRRSMLSNGVKLKSAAELGENMSAVLFCPEDLGLIREGAAVRRRLMDASLCQLRPRYAAALNLFNRAYEQKTRILRDSAEDPGLLELLDEYDDELARLSAELIHYRALFSRRLSNEAAKIHADFSGGEELSIEYKTVSGIEDPTLPASQLYPMIMEHQIRHRTAERASRLCLTGAHKDDLIIKINGADARAFSSQGQARTAALSMKLAEREIHFSVMGEYPILLLDDVLSELDPGRQSFILNRIGGGQVFITCCEDDGVIAERTGGRVLTVKNGVIGGKD